MVYWFVLICLYTSIYKCPSYYTELSTLAKKILVRFLLPSRPLVCKNTAKYPKVKISEKMVKTRKMIKKKFKSSMNHNKIHECFIEMSRLNLKNLKFKEALFRLYDIRNCSVLLQRLDNEQISSPESPKKKRLLVSNGANSASVRSLVPWLPTGMLKSKL